METKPVKKKNTKTTITKKGLSSRAIATVETWDGETNKWIHQTEILRSELEPCRLPTIESLRDDNDGERLPKKPCLKYVAEQPRQRQWHSWEHQFLKGGRIRLYVSVLEQEDQMEISRELRRGGDVQTSTVFRSYKIQAVNEPRTHFMLHEEATENFDHEAQPGYKYGCTYIKSRPLGHFPAIAKLAKEVGRMCAVPNWNVGINPVLYRDGNDHMGFHSDDDQGEQTILTVVVESPATPRRVMIKPKTTKQKKNATRDAPRIQHGDQRIVLYLKAGDAYEMDGVLQTNYVHGVPKDTNQVGQVHHSRAVIVFRHGNKAMIQQDSGQPVRDLSPRDCSVTYRFGRIEGLEEGCVYTKLELVNMRAHGMLQRGISGHNVIGCDAVCMGGLPNNEAFDQYSKFFYTAATSLGAGAIITSAKNRLAIRVFRGSSLRGEFKALDANDKGGSHSLYRYDGLYRVLWVCYFTDNGAERCEVAPRVSTPVVRRWYHFLMERVPKGDSSHSNTLSVHEILAKSRLEYRTMPELEEGFNLSFYPFAHSPPFPRVLGAISFDGNQLRSELVNEINRYSSKRLDCGVYSILPPPNIDNELDFRLSPDSKQCIITTVKSLVARIFFRAGDRIVAVENDLLSNYYPYPDLWLKNRLGSGELLIHRPPPLASSHCSSKTTKEKRPKQTKKKRERSHSEKQPKQRKKRRERSHSVPRSLSGPMAGLKTILAGHDALVKQAMKDCILRSAVYACRSGRIKKKAEPFVGPDGVEYPDLRKAVALSKCLKACPDCKKHVQGAYFCRFFKKHFETADFDGGRESAVVLQPLLLVPLESLLCQTSAPLPTGTITPSSVVTP